MYSSREGNGHQTPSTAYPNQGVDLGHAANIYAGPPGTLKARNALIERSRSLNAKYAGKLTPFGTPVAQLARQGIDAASMLADQRRMSWT